MTKVNMNQNIATTNLAAFQERVNTLFADRAKWQTTVLATANQSLYQLLGNIYTIYLQAKDGADVNAQKHAWLLKEVQARNINTAKNPTFMQLITKFVFYESDTDSRRVNSYARVLNCAAQENVSTGNAIAAYITERGGIENIRAALAKNTKSPKQRAFEGRCIADTAKNVTVVIDAQLEKYATEAMGKYVVLIGKMNAQGKIEVKHVVFENEIGDQISGKTVINGALSNLYSNTEKARKKVAKRKLAEADSDAKNAIFNNTAPEKAKIKMKQAA